MSSQGIASNLDRSMASRKTHKPVVCDHIGPGDQNASDSDDVELKFKRPKFLARTRRSRSASPSSSSSSTPSGPDSPWESSPTAASSNGHSDSYWPSFSSPKVFKFSKSFGGRFGFRRSNGAAALRKERRARPMRLEQLPANDEEKAEYMTVVVGEGKGNRETFVINKQLLTHHLFQTLLKCSEDMIEPHSDMRSGVSIFCDPALFLHLVEVVGMDLASDHA